jgi:hypothetical protein
VEAKNFVIRFNTGGRTPYLGRGWAPVFTLSAAKKFTTREEAELRLADLKKIMAAPANRTSWFAVHIHEAEIVQ